MPKPKPATAKREKKKQITLVLPEKPAPVVTSPPVIAAPEPASVEPKTDHAKVAARIADQLGETRMWPQRQIKQIVWALGARQSEALAARAQEIHAAEGMLVKSEKRKRTVGGIFFALAYSEGKPREGKTLTRPE